MPIDFRLRSYLHPHRILRLRRVLERAQWMSRKELQAYQLRQLNRIIGHARTNVPYYRETFDALGLVPGELRSLEDLRSFPVLTKADLRRQGDRLLARGAERFSPEWHRTSGSTGAPVRFALDRASNALEFCYYWRFFGWAGYRLGDRFAELGSLHFITQPRLADSLVHWQPLYRRLMINSARISRERLDEVIAAIRRYRPRYLKGMASAVYHLARDVMDAERYDLHFDAVFSTGEVLLGSHRTVIAQAFECPVLDSYGHMERTVAICQCPQGGYHVNSDYGLLQYSDVREAPDGTRLGRVEGTSLYNMAMPLIRYDVGDDVGLLPGDPSCPCGRSLPLVKGVHGRTTDTIRTPDGRFLTAMFALFEMVDGVRAGQIHQETTARLNILVVPDDDWTAEHREKLLLLGRRFVGEGMALSVTLARDDDLVRDPSGKLRAVIGLGGG